MAPRHDPPLPGKVPPSDPALKRLRQFEESRGLPPSFPELDPDGPPAEPPPSADDRGDEEPPRPD